MNKSIMSEEAFNELIDDFEYVGSLTDYGRTNIKYHVQKLQQENKRLKDNWNKLKDELRKIRQSTFAKYGKNEWENCLSFNDDILPLIKKMQELEQGSDSDE